MRKRTHECTEEPVSLGRGKVNVSAEFTVNVRTLTGGYFQIRASPADSVFDLKGRIHKSEGIQAEQLLLTHNDRVLDDSSSLVDNGIGESSTLSLLVRMVDGPGLPAKQMRRSKDDTGVLLLLCKQNEELYVVEVQMKDGKPRSARSRKLGKDEMCHHGGHLEARALTVLPVRATVDSIEIKEPASPSLTSFVEADQYTIMKCANCAKKLGMTTAFTCRCGGQFCAQHRYSDRHDCSYDYRGSGRAALEIENPQILPEKLERI